MATKGPRRTGSKWGSWGKKIEETKKKRGTGRSSRMDEIMGGLKRDRRTAQAPKKKRK